MRKVILFAFISALNSEIIPKFGYHQVMTYLKFITAILFLSSSIALAHGEEKPGPHSGSIRMPGAFHVELILNDDQSAKIYLSDINFQNPTVQNSSVKMAAKDGKAVIPFACSPAADHFQCVPSKRFSKKAEIVIQAARDGKVGQEARYKLPLKFNQKSSGGHSHH
ncbi:hypothetical protein [Bdellovibrio reynosensis]|uniref:EfeO-type cupredoxin-like domain-containing protein n=1 Tax=Bdellovibrio reynosensis TaxID=2835041 RepID=A0ABY4CCC3_9BACT|nr:hypothetical protein [Bdellovibrio reynosensis]UOF01361.1 hypothetical protein MNR06_00135 [Bdellovibrio reynosensis]